MGLLEDNNHGTQDLVVEVVFLALDFVFVGLRLWARRLKRRTLEFNDYAILAALFSTTATYANSLILLSDPAKLTVAAKTNFAADILWCATVTSIKLSILHLYTVIFRKPTFRHTCFVVMALTVTFCVAYFFAILFQCHPIAFYWDPTIVNGRCDNQTNLFISTATLNLLLDVIIVFMPVPVVWGLQMATTRKVAVTAIFGMGIIVCILTGVRIKLALDVDYSDTTYSFIDFGTLSSFEFYLGNLTACLPLLSPAFSKISSSMKGGSLMSVFSWTRRSTRRLLSRGTGDGSFTGRKFTKASDDVSQDRDFERIDDLGCPLVKNRFVQNDALASFDMDHLPSKPHESHQAIQVTSDFTVQSRDHSELN